MVECPYCGDDKKPRGLKNHVRMAGPPHGDAGTVPDDFDSRIRADDEPDEADETDENADSGASAEVTTVTPEQLAEVHSDESDGSDGDDGDDDGLPFDPNDPDAIALDGGETLDLRVNGEVRPGVKAESGDYLLKTDKGPVLYDGSTGDMYEVLTV